MPLDWSVTKESLQEETPEQDLLECIHLLAKYQKGSGEEGSTRHTMLEEIEGKLSTIKKQTKGMASKIDTLKAGILSVM